MVEMVDILNVVVGLFGTVFLAFCAWGLLGFLKPTKVEKERGDASPFNLFIVILMIVLCGFFYFKLVVVLFQHKKNLYNDFKS